MRTASGCSASGTLVCPFGGSVSSNSVPILPLVSQRMPDLELLERSATELLQDLIRFDTVNPPGNEQAAQNFLQDKLEAAGFECVQLAAVDGGAHLGARPPGRSAGAGLGRPPR